MGAPDYYKSILLYGISDGVALPAHIEPDGRFVFRVEDFADAWGVAAQTGIAELIACLTGTKIFDRRGQVRHFESFEGGLDHVLAQSTGTGGGVALETTRARTGYHSAKLTGGSDSTRTAGIQLAAPYEAAVKVGLEVSFTYHVRMEEFRAQLYARNTETAHEFHLRYRPTEHDLSYLDTDGNYQVIRDDIYLYESNLCFHTMKMVVDLATMKYVRYQLNSWNGSLAGVAGRDYGAATKGYMLFTAFLKSLSGYNAVSYVDDLIITQNEP